ncbi:anthrone oxygenase family protein [Actinomycetospora sp. OC33-EN08]|uniref:Anthrone oxygenase family protein n=1 Tax=Actinomycetospora aurantiaca TaxID=3129233 RepID=A0ABU8MR05_9PSEU
MSLLGVVAPVAGGVLAGVYLAFDLAVMPALRRTRVPVGGPGPAPDPAATMRAINVAIVRPAFLALLLGVPVLAVTAAVAGPTPWTVTAAALQVAGLVVTMTVNVPLNGRLDAGGPWERFVGPWVRAHRVRTAATLLAVVAGLL